MILSPTYKPNTIPRIAATTVHSSCDKYERLIVDVVPPENMRIPLDEIPCATATEENSVVSDISDEDDVIQPSSTEQLVDAVPRSIFPSYLKGDAAVASGSCQNGTGSSLKAVALRGSLSGIRSPCRPKAPLQDPYQYLGIDCEQDQVQCDDEDSSSLNTYERTLFSRGSYERKVSNPPWESRPLWMTFFGGNKYASEPQLLGVSLNYSRVIKSDTHLVKRPQKSCLRHGRFSTTAMDTGKSSPHSPVAKVAFQPRIEVHVYQPPVEQWSPKGWSSFFG